MPDVDVTSLVLPRASWLVKLWAAGSGPWLGMLALVGLGAAGAALWQMPRQTPRPEPCQECAQRSAPASASAHSASPAADNALHPQGSGDGAANGRAVDVSGAQATQVGSALQPRRSSTDAATGQAPDASGARAAQTAMVDARAVSGAHARAGQSAAASARRALPRSHASAEQGARIQPSAVGALMPPASRTTQPSDVALDLQPTAAANAASQRTQPALDAPSTPPPPDLAAELALLRKAYASLNAGQAQVALRWLDEHVSRFPHGQLRESRELAMMLALCAVKIPRQWFSAQYLNV